MEGAQKIWKRPNTHFYMGYYSAVFDIKHYDIIRYYQGYKG